MLEDSNVSAFDVQTTRDRPPKVRGARRMPSAEHEAAAIALLPVAKRRASVVFLEDIERCAARAGGQPFAVERCATYYVPSGTLAIDTARPVFGDIMAMLGAVEVSAQEAFRRGLTPRPRKAGDRTGRFLFFPDPNRARAIRDALVTLGVSRSPGRCDHTKEEERPIVARGRYRFTNCTRPEHPDLNPSAQVNESGIVFCYKCGTVGHAHPSREGYVWIAPLRAPAPSRPAAKFLPASPSTLDLALASAPESPRRARASQGGVLDYVGIRSAKKEEYSESRVERAGRPGVPCSRLPYVLARRERHEADDPALFARGRSSSKAGLIDLQIRADRVAGRPDAYARALAEAARDEARGRRPLPDMLVSLSRFVVGGYVDRVMRGRVVASPSGFTPRAVDHVGVDLDSFECPGDDRLLVDAAHRIEAMAIEHMCLSGRVAVTRTSPRGLQVVFELARTRWDPLGFYADPDVQAFLWSLATFCLEQARSAGFEGGHVDPSMFGAHRYARRPGARIKEGGLCVARLVYASAPVSPR